MSSSPDHQWEKFYQQTIDRHAQAAAAATVPETVMSADNMVLSPNSTSTSCTSSKGNTISSPKPIRRRSRASKKTPTTLLNANTTNFRALVQQFTGCPTTCTLQRSGPVDLNFGLGSAQNGSILGPFGHNYYRQQSQQQQQQQQEQECLNFQQQEQQQHLYSFRNHGPANMGIPEGMVMGNNYFHDEDLFSGGNMNGSYFLSGQ